MRTMAFCNAGASNFILHYAYFVATLFVIIMICPHYSRNIIKTKASVYHWYTHIRNALSWRAHKLNRQAGRQEFLHLIDGETEAEIPHPTAVPTENSCQPKDRGLRREER